MRNKYNKLNNLLQVTLNWMWVDDLGYMFKWMYLQNYSQCNILEIHVCNGKHCYLSEHWSVPVPKYQKYY